MVFEKLMLWNICLYAYDSEQQEGNRDTMAGWLECCIQCLMDLTSRPVLKLIHCLIEVGIAMA